MILLLVSIVSLAAATIMSIFAWQVARQERLRSRARVERLAEEITSARAVPRIRAVVGGTLEGPPGGSFLESAAAQSGSSLGVRFAIGALILAGVIALIVAMSGGSPTAPVQRRPSPGAPEGQASQLPIELVALGQERTSGGLTVRGVVRNPPAGAKIGPVTATVLLFDHGGGFLGSGRSALETPVLVPGGESTFSVTVQTTSEVERYRVGFRAGDQPVLHVDRRSQR
jgi:hypothetical protein